MNITIRKAQAQDLDAVAGIYANIHTVEEQGLACIGWQRGVYPERATAEAALLRGDLFVEELDGHVAGTAILNQVQVDVYAGAPWQHSAPDDRVMVMHTLVVDPLAPRCGLGRAMVSFYGAGLPLSPHGYQREKSERPPVLRGSGLSGDCPGSLRIQRSVRCDAGPIGEKAVSRGPESRYKHTKQQAPHW